MYERAEDLINLALRLQALRHGVSLKDIQRDFGVSRRTAERMVEALRRIFPGVDEIISDENQVKRWTLYSAQVPPTYTVAEFEELRLAAERLRQEGLAARADTLDGLVTKLTGQIQTKKRSAFETDFDALMVAEGHALRPGPRPKVTTDLLETIRSAITAPLVLQLRYRSRRGGKTSDLLLEPHGILFGRRHYLVAFSKESIDEGPRLYSLSNIEEATLTNEAFVIRDGFDLSRYTERAFGVFQEAPISTVWVFKPEVAEDVLEHSFHPTEKKRPLPDGSIEVSFTAGGMLEMCWHLFTWGDTVDIRKPAALRAEYEKQLVAARQALGTDARVP